MIEQYNNQITNRIPFKMPSEDFVRGSVNVSLIKRYRKHISIHGYPEPFVYENQRKKVKIKSTIHYGKE